MPGDDFRWNEWNLTHIAQHSVSAEEAEYVITNAKPPYPVLIVEEKWKVWGQTANGRYLQLIFLYDPGETIYVIHARGLSDREKRRLRRRRR